MINRKEKLTRSGAIPYNNLKEKNRIINQLKKEFGRIKINLDDGIILYEYKEYTY